MSPEKRIRPAEDQADLENVDEDNTNVTARCRRCQHRLTAELSIRCGVGPVCRGRQSPFVRMRRPRAEYIAARRREAS